MAEITIQEIKETLLGLVSRKISDSWGSDIQTDVSNKKVTSAAMEMLIEHLAEDMRIKLQLATGLAYVNASSVIGPHEIEVALGQIYLPRSSYNGNNQS